MVVSLESIATLMVVLSNLHLLSLVGLKSLITMHALED